jgi:DNA-binding NarL/FixJ family response regulator
MHGICLLLKNGLNGFFFTDQSLIDLKQVFYERTKYKITADKLKLILRNKKAPIEIKQLSCVQVSLSLNEIEFIQACVRDETYEEIALRMQKNVKTINGYRDSVFKKLQVKQRTAMVLAALRRNLIDL